MNERILLIGSGNRDKAAELAELLGGLPWLVRSLRDYEAVEEPEEDGATFAENALLKARYYGGHFQQACVADDSGLMVDALDGAPGVYSARYAGEDCTYEDNNAKLLRALAGIPPEQRTARFVCCAALVFLDGTVRVETGTVEGQIAESPRGAGGFGYDPLFVPTGHGKTFAELTPAEKHAISHRGRAFRQVRTYLESVR